MSDKKSFVMYDKWGDIIEDMSDEEAGKLLKAVFAYQRDPEAVPDKTDSIYYPFRFIQQQLDADNQRYKEVCAARATAGKKGGEAKAANQQSDSKSKQDVANATKSKQKVANVADYDNDHDNDNKKENTLKGVKEKRFAPPTVEEVEAYCRESGCAVDAENFVNHYTAVGWMCGKSPITDWQAKVKTWAKNEKKDPAKQRAVSGAVKNNRFHNLEEHGYDYAAIVDRMGLPSAGGTMS